MPDIASKTLKILAGLVWLAGGLVLLTVGIERLVEVGNASPADITPWGIAAGALCLGTLKARLIFVRFGRRNLARIDRLPHPRLWQVFSPGFLAALGLMIVSAGLIHRLAAGSAAGLSIAAGIDLTIGCALLGSLDAWLKE
jgi:hypothetical protein